MIGILGSGFGLYGYLPAIAQYKPNEKIALVQRYKEIFDTRSELSKFENNILWVANEMELYGICDTLTVSLSPEQQYLAIKHVSVDSSIRYMLLEKPLSVTPRDAQEMLSLLANAQKKIRIGYTFQYTDWFALIKEKITTKNITNITINWRFKAHHYRNDLHNWKRYHSKGGGVIRFYGIHCIAIASLMKYDDVHSSNTIGFSDSDLYAWSVTFKGTNLPNLEININSNVNENSFIVRLYEQQNQRQVVSEIHQADPFNKNVLNSPGNIDPRIQFLRPVIISLFEDPEQDSFYQIYRDCNLLWEKVEFVNINRVVLE